MRIEEPTVTHDATFDGERYRHPAYGMISVSRVQGSTALFGSDFMHRDYLVLRIKTAEMVRFNSHDSHFARDYVVEIALSEAQWASFVSTMNRGDGVPCTIMYRSDAGEIPALPRMDRQNEFKADFSKTIDELMGRLKALQGQLEGAKSKTAVERLNFEVGIIMGHLKSNIPFVANSFGEYMEARAEKAKVEVSAWMMSAIVRAGLGTLASESPPIAIEHIE